MKSPLIASSIFKGIVRQSSTHLPYSAVFPLYMSLLLLDSLFSISGLTIAFPFALFNWSYQKERLICLWFVFCYPYQSEKQEKWVVSYVLLVYARTSTLVSTLTYHFSMYFRLFLKKFKSIIAFIHINISSNTVVYTILVLFFSITLKEAAISLSHLSYINCELIHSSCFFMKALTNCLLSISVVSHDWMQADQLNQLKK